MRKFQRSLGHWIGLFAVLLLVARGAAAGERPHLADPSLDHVPGEILVAFKSDAKASDKKKAAGRVGAKKLRDFPGLGIAHWKLGKGVKVEKALEILAKRASSGAIEFAEPNYVLHASDVPNDPRRGELWAVHNLGQAGGTPDADIDLIEAWQVTQGSANVVVAVIDTGIDYDHEDLAANVWVNPGEIAGNGVDDDGNGYVDDVHGWDFYNDDDDPFDDNGHGTHVSGTIGAIGNNGIGVVGVNRTVRIMALKFLSSGGSGNTADAISAVKYASTFAEVRVMNASFGGGRRSKSFERAIERSGALFVAAAGNHGSDSLHYPAAYDVPNVLAVAATDRNDELASFSAFGSWVHLAAPGVDILSTLPGNSYGAYNGTSMAAPHAAGVAALLLADAPGLSPEEVKAQLLASVDPLTQLAGLVTSGGRLNAAAALGAPALPADPTPPSTPVLTIDSIGGTSIAFSWTAPGDDGSSGSAYLYDVRSSTSPIDASNFADATPAAGAPLPSPAGTPESFELGGLLSEETYYTALQTLDLAGNTSLAFAGLITTVVPPGGFHISVVDDSGGQLGAFSALAYDGAGRPAIAYTPNYTPGGPFRYAWYDGASWNLEDIPDVDGSPIGVDLVFHPVTGEATLGYGWRHGVGDLRFTTRQDAGNWDFDFIEQSNPGGNEYPSLAYDAANNPAIAFRGNVITQQTSGGKGKKGRGGQGGTTVVSPAGLKLARRDTAGNWTVDLVDETTACRYLSLAFGADGNPAIAYSDDLDGDNSLDALKFARFDGSTWQVEVVEQAASGGYAGLTTCLRFDAGGAPVIVHATDAAVRYLRKSGGAWQGEDVDQPDGNAIGTSLAFDGSGNAHLAFHTDQAVFVAQRDGSGAWSIDEIDRGSFFWLDSPLALDPTGLPSVAYYDSDRNVLKFARKKP